MGLECGSIEGILTDGTQGIGIFGSQEVCGGAGCCQLDRGITRAYFSDYVEEFEAHIRSCVASCASGNCDLVLTGHSQGAAISQIAGVALADLNPLLFAFGPQKMIHAWHTPCGALNNMETFYRTVSQCEDDAGEPLYDSQTLLGVLWGRQTGTMILVGDGGAQTMAINRDVTLMPARDQCHNVFLHYMDPISQLMAGPLDGFVSGSKCTRNMECKSQSCADNNRCR